MTLQVFLESLCKCFLQKIMNEKSDHMLNMTKTLRKYVHQLNLNNKEIRNLFLCDIKKIKNLFKQEQEELTDLIHNGTIKNIFNNKKTNVFLIYCLK